MAQENWYHTVTTNKKHGRCGVQSYSTAKQAWINFNLIAERAEEYGWVVELYNNIELLATTD